jgi:hypothetical protein
MNKRIDPKGRDVTDLPGLWSEEDTMLILVSEWEKRRDEIEAIRQSFDDTFRKWRLAEFDLAKTKEEMDQLRYEEKRKDHLVLRAMEPLVDFYKEMKDYEWVLQYYESSMAQDERCQDPECEYCYPLYERPEPL